MGQGSSEKGNGCNRATPRGCSDEELAAAFDVFSSLLLLLTNCAGEEQYQLQEKLHLLEKKKLHLLREEKNSL